MPDIIENEKNEVKLGDIADVVAGQILARITSKNNEGKTVPVMTPKSIVAGVIIRKDLGSPYWLRQQPMINIPGQGMLSLNYLLHMMPHM